MPLSRERTSRAGFTLVEVIVSILVVALIMVGLSELLNAARTSRDTIHNIQETQLAGPAILDLIERDLRAIDVYDRDKKWLLRLDNRVVLGHDADGLDFVATTDSVIQTELQRRIVRSDENEVGYRARVSQDDDEFLELYRREDYGIDDEPFDSGAYTLLHDHVKHFDIVVFDEDGRDAEQFEQWGTDEEHVGLPLRIEIRLTLELTPRITREQLRVAPTDQRTLTYTRIVRLPQNLQDQLELAPAPRIPVINAPQAGGANNGGTPPPVDPGTKDR